MVASSAAYERVESLYPIRYRFRSWADAETGQLIGLEAYEKTLGQGTTMVLPPSHEFFRLFQEGGALNGAP